MTTAGEKDGHKSQLIAGVISDTHGTLPLSATRVFDSVDIIIHAGDIGSLQVLDELTAVAPVVAVHGNMDHGAWSAELASERTVRLGQILVYVCHILTHDASLDKRCAVVVYGHTHRPSCVTEGGVLYVNPGSAGNPRHGFPPTVAILTIDGPYARARLIELNKG
jgi:putative phosphoesterase